MEYKIIFLAVMILVASLLTILGNRIRVSYPVLLVIAGLVISFLPFVPTIELDPEIVFYIFLPPLLYMSAIEMPLKEILNWKRVILCFAFLVVFLTAAGIGLMATWMVPGMTLAMGMVLGGILGPTDAVSATCIMQQVKVPNRVSTILEGESLLNDASSLITFSFALVAVQTGSFVFQQALVSFIWMVIGGGVIGVLVGMFFTYLHKWLPEKDPNVVIILTIIAPYMMYIVAEACGASGVLGVVCGSFYMARNIEALDSNSRLLGRSIWNNLIFVLNGLAFLLIGLNLPHIVNGLQADGISITRATIFGLCITAIIMLIRMACAYLAIPLSRIRRKRHHLGNELIVDVRTSFIIGWCGMRGVVSLAAALSIPYLLPNGDPFPYRSLMLYSSFVVIFTTLVLQGLSLPIFLKHIRFPEYRDHLDEAEAIIKIRKALAECGIKYLEEHPVEDAESHRVFAYFKDRWKKRMEIDSQESLVKASTDVYHKIMIEQRKYLFRMIHEHPEIEERLINKFILGIDLGEERLKNDNN